MTGELLRRRRDDRTTLLEDAADGRIRPDIPTVLRSGRRVGRLLKDPATITPPTLGGGPDGM
jgi:hypothetical protein